MSLVTLMVAIACNSLVALFLLPSLANGQRARPLFYIWLWVNEKGSLYGWIPVGMGLLAWDYFVWRVSRPKIKGWISRKLLTLLLAGGIAPFIPWWIPAGQPPQGFLAALAKYPGLPSIVAWGIVVFVTTLLCMNAETRDSLLGRGKVLSLVGLGVLLLVLTMTLVGWSMSCPWTVPFGR